MNKLAEEINTLLVKTKDDLISKVEDRIYNANLIKDMDKRLLVAERIVYVCFTARRSLSDDFLNIIAMIEKIITEELEDDI